MPADALLVFEPRKTPIQARSTTTVEAISETTIQVFVSHLAERLTTTRVAERAEVSVGTPGFAASFAADVNRDLGAPQMGFP